MGKINEVKKAVDKAIKDSEGLKRKKDLSKRGEGSLLIAKTGHINSPPVAQINSLFPNPAVQGQTITFSGSGSDPDGTITGYKWEADGTIISTQASFTKSDFTADTYTISFKVKEMPMKSRNYTTVVQW